MKQKAGTKDRLSAGKILSLSLMLFAMFFGAGNMIFPPALGQQAGTSFVAGVFGFILTDAGLSVLGIAAVVLAGSHLDDLSGRIGPRFSVALGVVLFLLIGPLFALPRTGTVSFEMALLPFLPQGASAFFPCLAFTFVFFLITFFLSRNPSRLVDIVGKCLTPVLLVAIGLIFAGSLLHPPGPIVQPVGDYARMPFFKGLLEGYLALDGPAALVFAMIVINSVKESGIRESRRIARYTLLTGFFAVLGLGITYMALGYAGAVTSSMDIFENGGQLLSWLTSSFYGTAGVILLGVAVLLACLTTAIGLASSFSDYFHGLLPRFSYQGILAGVCLFSFLISNLGLSQLIHYTLPALMMLYPPLIVMVALSFFDRFFKSKPEAYAMAMIFAFAVGVLNGLESLELSLGALGEAAALLPWYELGVGWILPALVGFGLGLLPGVRFLGGRAVALKSQRKTL